MCTKCMYLLYAIHVPGSGFICSHLFKTKVIIVSADSLHMTFLSAMSPVHVTYAVWVLQFCAWI